MRTKEFGNFLREVLPTKIESLDFVGFEGSEVVLTVCPENLYEVLFFLKYHSSGLFNCLVDITAVDYPEREKRFDVYYFLLSVSYNSRIRIRTQLDEFTSLNSITSLFSSSNWFEREVWEMFGIYFINHPDLRRLLTDYGFEGYPLRKDFPVTGFFEVRYDEKEKRILSDRVEVAQDFRVFNFLSPWSGK